MPNNGFLSLSGFYIPVPIFKSRLGARYTDLLRKLTVTYYPKIGPPKRVNMYSISDGNVYLPRTLITALCKNRIIDSVDVRLPDIKTADIKCIELYENQRLIVDHLCANIFNQDRIRNGTATAILNLRAGQGKTFVAAGVISRLGLKTLYIVPKRPLMNQAVKDLRLSCPDAKISAYTEGVNADIVVIVINSALDRDPSFYLNYSFVIYDEVHSYCSESRREIFKKTSTHACLGMSATTEDRVDGFDIIAHKELAVDGIIRAENIQGFRYENVDFDCHARVIMYSGPVEHTRNLKHDSTGSVFTPYMHKQFLRDPYRMRVFINELLRLYDWTGPLGEKHSIYIFAEEIELLKLGMEAMTGALIDRQRAVDIIAPELGLEMFTGGLKDAEVGRIASEGRILFSTYGYAGTGISISKMSCILFLTPRKAQMKQICARIIRRDSDLNIPRIIVDIVDAKTCLYHQLGHRMLAYNHYGFEIEKIKISHVDL